MKQARRKKLATVIGCMLLYASWAPAVFAADAADDEVVEEVDVTDTRLKERLAIKKTEITSEDIKAQGAETAAQVLEKQSGIVVSGNNMQGKAAVSIRGSDATNTKVFVDGVPLNSLDGIVDLNSIAADSIEKIEVYKGAAPVQYGSDAGGVIYITTKKGGKQSATFSTSVGSWNTLRQSASLSGGNQKINYYFDVKHETSDGYTVNTAKRDNYYDGKLDFALNATASLTLSGSYAKKYEELPDRYDQNGVLITNPGSGGQIGKPTNTSSFWYQTARLRLDPAVEWHSGLTYNQKLNDTSDMKLTLYKSGDNASMYATKLPTGSGSQYAGGQNSTAGVHGFQLEHSIKTSSVNTVLWGYNREMRQFSQDTYWQIYDDTYGHRSYGYNCDVPVQYHYDSRGYFLQDTLKLDKLTSTLGYRYNSISDSFRIDPNDWASGTHPGQPNFDPGYRQGGLATSHSFRDPVAGFSYAMNDRTELHASVGKSFRYPQPAEIASSSTIGTSLPLVKPEQTLNRDLGVAYTTPDGLHLDVTYFNKKVTDKIQSMTVVGQTVFGNLSEVTMKGFETEVSKKLNDRISTFAQLTYTSAKDPQKGRQINDEPEYKYTMGMNYTGGRGLKAYLALNYMGSRFSDFSNGSAGASDPTLPPEFQSVTLAPYTSVDLMLTKELKNREYYVKFNNMLDKQYYSSAYLIAPGRYVEYGVKIKFQ
jgi:outer membrane receptor protein involved in Fe transport